VWGGPLAKGFCHSVENVNEEGKIFGGGKIDIKDLKGRVGHRVAGGVPSQLNIALGRGPEGNIARGVVAQEGGGVYNSCPCSIFVEVVVGDKASFEPRERRLLVVVKVCFL
jgi:hypothetical protein